MHDSQMGCEMDQARLQQRLAYKKACTWSRLVEGYWRLLVCMNTDLVGGLGWGRLQNLSVPMRDRAGADLTRQLHPPVYLLASTSNRLNLILH